MWRQRWAWLTLTRQARASPWVRSGATTTMMATRICFCTSGVGPSCFTTTASEGLAAAAGDLRGTGHQDLFIANDYGVSELYFNNGNKFREVGEHTGVGFAPKSGMNAAFGDILNQGKFAVYVSNISEPGVLIQGNNLWVPKEGTASDGLQYENIARALGVARGGWS